MTLFMFVTMLFSIIFSCFGARVFAFQTDSPNAYTKWLGSLQTKTAARLGQPISTPSVAYKHHTYLGNNQEVALHWSVDTEDEVVHLAAAVEASGWVALGISEVGGMPGSDMFIFEASKPDKIIDAHATEYARPIVDLQQDWTLLASTVEDGFIIVELKRALDTGDTNDWPLKNDVANLAVPGTFVIAAWGETAKMQYHGKNWAKGEVRFHQNAGFNQVAAFDKFIANHAEGYVDMRASNYKVPSQKTTYHSICFTSAELGLPLGKEVHIIGFELLYDTQTFSSSLIHHILLYSSPSKDKPAARKCGYGAQYFMAGWSIGLFTKTKLPDDVGFLAGGSQETATRSFRIEIHYNNPLEKIGSIDSSGFRVYYTSKLRRFHAGSFSLADPKLMLIGEKIGEGLTKHVFSNSLSQALPKEGVTVFTELLHMHRTGMRIVNQQIRDGREIRRGEVEYWDFDQQSGLFLKQQSFVVKPGDMFNTTCYYNADNSTVFGLGTDDEMCVAYLLFFHLADRLETRSVICALHSRSHNFEGCNVAYKTAALVDKKQVGRTFGTLTTQDNHVLQPMKKNTTSKHQTYQNFNKMIELKSKEKVDKGVELKVLDAKVVLGIFFLVTLGSLVLIWCKKNGHRRSCCHSKLGLFPMVKKNAKVCVE